MATDARPRADNPTAISSPRHFGVYGVAIRGARVLVVRKARGPYAGWLDLPGGRPSTGEAESAALNREFMEEVGVNIRAMGRWFSIDIQVSRDSAGHLINFRHLARVRLVDLVGDARDDIRREDVEGALWVPIDGLRRRKDLSPLATEAFNRLGLSR
jgi:ADP-ribose pyrophosphatase YjhB (NUDIX family)